MTKSNSSATLSTSNLYEHPWFNQLRLLDNTTTCESQSQQKLKSVTPGQKSTKQCSKCKKTLPLSSFSPSSGANYVRPECKECNRKLAKARRDLNKKYGKPPTDYSCPICLRTESELQGRGGNAGVWVVDHDHDTDQFRGHLCHSCNRAIGMLQDNTAHLSRAILYLNRNGHQI